MEDAEEEDREEEKTNEELPEDSTGEVEPANDAYDVNEPEDPT